MPAIASLEDLKAAQKGKLLSPQSALLSADERWLEECVWSPMGKGRAIQRLGGGDIPRLTSGQAVQELNGLLCRGKLWLEERSPEQLKGEGG